MVAINKEKIITSPVIFNPGFISIKKGLNEINRINKSIPVSLFIKAKRASIPETARPTYEFPEIMLSVTSKMAIVKINLSLRSTFIVYQPLYLFKKHGLDQHI